MPNKQVLVLALLFMFSAALPVNASEKPSARFWVASGEDGIYSGELNLQTGKIQNFLRTRNSSAASYLVKHPVKNILYAVSREENSSKLSTWRIQKNGEITLQSELEKRPAGGAHINVSPNGKWLAVAYYSSGTTGVYKLDKKGNITGVVEEVVHTGASVNKERQTMPHPHWAGFSKDSQFLYVPDLGTDHIWIYKLNQQKSGIELIQKAEAPKGAGPRHLAFHPTLKLAFVSDELQSNISRYAHNPKNGELTWIDNTFSAKEIDTTQWHNVSDIRVHPNGKFVYLLNRGFDFISVFSINSVNGALTPVEREAIRGSIARNINIDPTGNWALVAGTGSNTLGLFKVDLTTGELYFTEQLFSLPSPMAIVFE